MKVEIKRNPTDPSAYDLIVNGAVQVEAETMEVCEAVRSELLGGGRRHKSIVVDEYSEADEIADNISKLEEGRV